MPELINLLVGITAIASGGLIIGLLFWIKEVTGRLIPLWLRIFSIFTICVGVYLVLDVCL